MNAKRPLSMAAVVVTSVCLLALPVLAQQPPKVQIPQPGVPQIMTLQGRYVRAAYNDEGYAILGYRAANLSVGEEWLLLEVGFALREGVPDYEMTREALSLETPDGKTIPLAVERGIPEGEPQRAAGPGEGPARLDQLLPAERPQSCRIGFFAELDQRAMAWDTVELSDQRACLGRLFFQVPGGITYGQHWLSVRFAKSVVRVPFRVLTKEEDKLLDKNYEDIKKQVDEAFRKKR